jgi:aubergine
MRQETIYDILRNCRNENRHSSDNDFRENFKKEILGTTVLTGYNNHTYRVDDVDFISSPKTTFDQRGVPITYADYYKNKYNLEIRDRDQPMLVSNPKAADVRAGRTQVIFLVPELCRATGLTDKMRADFRMMKAMAEHTQLDPERRRNRLLDFTSRLHSQPACVNQMESFNTNIDEKLVTFSGRALKQETMVFGGGKT